MSRFKFGDLRVDVNRLGPVPENPQLEAYSVKVTVPKSDDWIESRIVSQANVRSSGSDFFLAAVMLANLEMAARDPKLWAIATKAIRDISPEEIQATVAIAQRLAPYLAEANREAYKRFPLYQEHREGKIGPLEMGIARHLQLPEHIGNKEEIAQFFAYLYIVDHTDFHPDEDFSTFSDREGNPAYTEDQANLRNALMVEALQAADAEHLDLSEVALWVQGLIFDNEELTADAPKWLRKLSKEWI
jgi:hypothetical protein